MLNKRQDQSFGDNSVGVQAGRDAHVQIGLTQKELDESIKTTLKVLQDSYKDQIDSLKEDKTKLEQQLTEAIRALTYKSQDLNESEVVRRKFEHALKLIKDGSTLEAENLFLEIENNELENIEKSLQLVVDAALNRGALAYLRDTNAAISAYERVLQLKPNNLVAQFKLGYLFMRSSKLDKSEKIFKQTLSAAKQQNNPELEASSYSALGQTYFCMGNYKESMTNQRKAITIRKTYGDIFGCVGSYIELAHLSSALGQFPEAKNLIKDAEVLLRQNSDDELGACFNTAKGVIYSSLNESNEAEKAFVKALDYAKRLGNMEAIANAYGNLGILYKNTGRVKKAEEMFKSSIEIEKELSHPSGLASDLVNLANLYLQMGELQSASDCCSQAFVIFQNIKSKKGLIAVHSSRAGIFLQSDKFADAKENLNEAIVLERDIGNTHGEAKALVQLSQVLIALNEKENAIANLKKANRMFEKTGDNQRQKLVMQLLRDLK